MAIETIGVIGTGAMGSGIIEVAAKAGSLSLPTTSTPQLLRLDRRESRGR